MERGDVASETCEPEFVIAGYGVEGVLSENVETSRVSYASGASGSVTHSVTGCWGKYPNKLIFPCYKVDLNTRICGFPSCRVPSGYFMSRERSSPVTSILLVSCSGLIRVLALLFEYFCTGDDVYLE